MSGDLGQEKLSRECINICNHLFMSICLYILAAKGSSLGRYQDNKMKKDRKVIPKLEIYDSPDNDAWTSSLFKAETQNLARRLSGA
ncbi:unnamed protein product [Ceratitis capitata]|uniref:(Mediterranean fruit fly) hypothetical protein n=1 Tax=Ceratitis capitata TaxID=7213 RepID=A0A811UUQ4_CERCA|nr:unnamed protein product [Ceratitis capitata]